MLALTVRFTSSEGTDGVPLSVNHVITGDGRPSEETHFMKLIATPSTTLTTACVGVRVTDVTGTINLNDVKNKIVLHQVY